MSKKKIYPRTKPSRSGFILMATIIAMLMASMNYSNNMGYILCFLLISLMLVSYLHTRNNLKELDITNIQAETVFASEPLPITFDLRNRSSAKRLALYCQGASGECEGDFAGPFSVDAGSCSTIHLTLPTPHRGKFTFNRVTLFSIYPLGLFQALINIPVEKVYIVYPQPAGSRQWPELEIHEDESTEGFYSRGGDDFVGVRPWRLGESMHHVDWKAVARGRPLSIKEFTGGGNEQLWFAWEQLSGIETEERLCQLARWVLEADQEGREFGLRMPGRTIPLDYSPGHATKCLETLAIYGYAD